MDNSIGLSLHSSSMNNDNLKGRVGRKINHTVKKKRLQLKMIEFIFHSVMYPTLPTTALNTQELPKYLIFKKRVRHIYGIS